MEDNFNDLSPAQTELLACLAEEAGEVVQAVGKILRHGYFSSSPHVEDGLTNLQLLESELGDMNHIIDRLCLSHDISRQAIYLASAAKAQRIGQYLHHN